MESKFAVDLKDGVAQIQLSGNLDTMTAPTLQEELKKLAGAPIKSLVFLAKELEYISSAGLRVIIFAKQKIGANAQVYLIGAGESIISVIKMSGLDNFMHIQETFSEQ